MYTTSLEQHFEQDTACFKHTIPTYGTTNMAQKILCHDVMKMAISY